MNRLRSHGLRLKNLVRVALNVDDARQEAIRASAFLFAHRVTPFLGVDHDDIRFVLSTHDPNGVSFPTFIRGYFEEEAIRNTLTALAQHAGIPTLDGLTVLEVGANIGTETVSLIIRHGVKRVIAVEPDPENVRFLRANLALNGLQDRVEVHQMALSDRDGTVLLEQDDVNWGDHRVRVAETSGTDFLEEAERTTAEVRAGRLDSMVADCELRLDEVDLIWIDAQGHEAHILDGAERLTDTDIPVVLEYWPYGLRRVGALDRLHTLIAQHYRAFVDLREPAVARKADRIAELADLYTVSSGGLDQFNAYTNLLLLAR